MPLVDLKSVALAAQTQKHGLGAFNVVILEHAQMQVAAAEKVGVPVVLQLSQNAVNYHGAFAPIGRAILEVARAASVPVVAHLDHAQNIDLCRAAVDLGFSSVMYDGSHLPEDENRAATATVVDFCHQAGVSVEAELGEVGGKNGVHDPAARTDPDDAAQFVADTGVDLLAVAVGSSHTMTTRNASLDCQLISAIHAQVPVPLVLHGSSGVSDDGMREAIASGMTKINVSTHLNVLFTHAVRQFLRDNPDTVDPRKYYAPGNNAVRNEVERLLRWYTWHN